MLLRRENVIALTMYQRLSNYDPWNTYIQNYKNKGILALFKKISEEKITKRNTLLQILNIKHSSEIKLEQQIKTKHKKKIQIKTLKSPNHSAWWLKIQQAISWQNKYT